MFDQLWIIKNSICYYHKNWTQYPIKVDNLLFSGLFSAFTSFQEEMFPNQSVNYIDFVDSRLIFLKYNNLIFIIRDSINKPLSRSLTQLNNFIIEIMFEIQYNKKFNDLLILDKELIMSDDEIFDFLDPIVQEIISSQISIDTQTNKFDILAIISVLRDLRILFTKSYGIINFSQFDTHTNLNWAKSMIQSDKPINQLEIQFVDYDIINSFSQIFLEIIIMDISYMINSKNYQEYFQFKNNLFNLFVTNYEILTKFHLENFFVTKFLSALKF